MIRSNHLNEPIVFFDGNCVLCSSSVHWVLQKERNHYLKFAALQSDFTDQFLAEIKLDKNQLPDSILFWNDQQMYIKSEAAFKIAEYLKFPWSFIRVFRFLPKRLNNFFYDIIARNRYKWFGKRNNCFIPSDGEKYRFLSEE